jgi:hypothetical protein
VNSLKIQIKLEGILNQSFASLCKFIFLQVGFYICLSFSKQTNVLYRKQNRIFSISWSKLNFINLMVYMLSHGEYHAMSFKKFKLHSIMYIIKGNKTKSWPWIWYSPFQSTEKRFLKWVARKVQYLGHSYEFGGKSDIWTRVFLLSYIL